jgi:hypothetical protein
MFPSSFPVILYAYIFGRGDNRVITSAVNKGFRLVDESQMWLKVKTNTASNVEVSFTIMSIIHGTSSCGFSVRNIYEYRYHLPALISLYFTFFTEVNKRTAVQTMKSLIALRPAAVAVIFDTSHISNLRQEPCRPLFVILSDNGTTAMQKYPKKVKQNTSFTSQDRIILRTQMTLTLILPNSLNVTHADSFNIPKLYVVPTECICTSTIITTNSDYFPVQYYRSVCAVETDCALWDAANSVSPIIQLNASFVSVRGEDLG